MRVHDTCSSCGAMVIQHEPYSWGVKKEKMALSEYLSWEFGFRLNLRVETDDDLRPQRVNVVISGAYSHVEKKVSCDDFLFHMWAQNLHTSVQTFGLQRPANQNKALGHT